MVGFGASYSFVKLVNGISLQGDFSIQQMSRPGVTANDSNAPWFVAGSVSNAFGDDRYPTMKTDAEVVIPLSSVVVLQ